MTYSGNSSLSQEIQQRILGTFDQTLQLAEQGTRQEALLGCDFILRLDPLFEPARRLQERLQSGMGPVKVSDLRTTAPAAEEGIRLQDLGDEVEAMDRQEEDLVQRFRGEIAARRFQAVLELASEHEELVKSSPRLRELTESAQSRVEAAPYLRAFLDSARQAVAGGNPEEAERLLEKARSLDPTHPELEGILSAGGAGAPPTSPADAFTMEMEAEPIVEAEPILDEEPVFEAAPIFDEEPVFELEPEPAPEGDSTREVEAIPLDEGSFGDFEVAESEEGEPEELAEDEVALDFDFGPDDEPGDEVPLSFEAAPEGEPEDESDQRIRELLGEGQGAFDRAEYQTAIDAWSRIFLIDIDHDEAAQRIDEARRLKAESERKVEEAFRTGETKLKAGDSDGATEAFQRVLELQPGHLAAREFLEQLASGTVPMGGEPDLSAMISARLPEPEGDLKQEILIPPEPEGAEPARRQRPPSITASARGPSRKIVVTAGVVALVVVMAALFLFLKRDALFPNAKEPATQGRGDEGPDPIERATKMHAEGKTRTAINQLKRLPKESPYYEQAQALLSQWEAATGPTEDIPDTAPSVDYLARREAVLDQARRAQEEGAFLRAAELFQQANSLAPLEGRDAILRDRLKALLAPFAEEVKLFRDGDCEFLIPNLWRMREADPGQPVVDRLLADCYYNLGLLDMQRGDLTSAIEKLGEAKNVDPADPGIQRTLLFAQTYLQRGEDLLYRIYVKYLPSR